MAILSRRLFPTVWEGLAMINKGVVIVLSCLSVMVMLFLLYRAVELFFPASAIDANGAYVVDGSKLRIFNSQLVVTNSSLTLRVCPTRKTTETVYVYAVDSEVWINGHRFKINRTSVDHGNCRTSEVASESIVSELPISFHFCKSRIYVAGASTWSEGEFEIESVESPYDVSIKVKGVCRIVILSNWYEFTG